MTLRLKFVGRLSKWSALFPRARGKVPGDGDGREAALASQISCPPHRPNVAVDKECRAGEDAGQTCRVELMVPVEDIHPKTSQ